MGFRIEKKNSETRTASAHMAEDVSSSGFTRTVLFQVFEGLFVPSLSI